MTKTKKAEQETPKVEQTPVIAENSYIKLELKKVASLKREFTDEQSKFVKQLVNPDLTDVELLVFLSFANKLELNPFLGEIIAIVYGKDTRDRKVNYIITRNGKRVVAARTGQLKALWSEAIYVAGGNECNPWAEGAVLWGAKAIAKRGGTEFPVTVSFKEYNTGKNVWQYKPETMIKKVAESQALSAAFPEILGSSYDESEAESISNGNGKVTLSVPDGDEPATDYQLQALEQQGYTPAELEGTTRAQAVKLLTSKKRKVEND